MRWDKASLMAAHINNLQNTCFWALVKSGLSTMESNRVLSVGHQVAALTKGDGREG